MVIDKALDTSNVQSLYSLLHTSHRHGYEYSQFKYQSQLELDQNKHFQKEFVYITSIHGQLSILWVSLTHEVLVE